jgi:hypothetical protein
VRPREPLASSLCVEPPDSKLWTLLVVATDDAEAGKFVNAATVDDPVRLMHLLQRSHRGCQEPVVEE